MAAAVNLNEAERIQVVAGWAQQRHGPRAEDGRRFPTVISAAAAKLSAGAQKQESRAPLKRTALASEAEKFDENFRQSLAGLPVVSVGQKHSAQFECELNDASKQMKASITKRRRDLFVASTGH